MRPTTIPDALLAEDARRVVFAAPDGDLSNRDIAPVEALVSRLGDGTAQISVRLTPEPGDLDKLAAGADLWLSFYGPIPVFSLDVITPDGSD